MKKIENDIIYIEHEKFDAVILLQGAQIINFTPKGKANIFWHTDLSYIQKGKAFRGGVPICWPWFNKAGTPSHGFARILPWELFSYEENSDGAKIVFSLRDSHESRAIWDHPFEVQMCMRLGESCKLELQIIKSQIPTTGALHSYFKVEDIAKVEVRGLGESYIDSLENGALKNSIGTLKIERQVDRIYTHPNTANTIYEDSVQKLCITHQNVSDVVCWNPWFDGAKNIADMKDDEASKMLCVESARINKPLLQSDIFGFKVEV